jgi:hypothetical protein
MSRPRKYPEELLERGVHLALESGRTITRDCRPLAIAGDDDIDESPHCGNEVSDSAPLWLSRGAPGSVAASHQFSVWCAT